MKKHIVLSLSVVLLAIGAELFAPMGRGGIQPSRKPQPVNPSQTQQIAPVTNPPVASATAEQAAQNCTLDDVAAAVADLGGDASKSTSTGKAAAKKFITGN